ncbi:putative aldouronate transport system permease protein [Caldicoprobacter guelmensis]|uniref:ABC transporter permease n=1 Tax=Caldicoprobacter guelmensis TaxID=1170224 RepID=UPI00195CDFAE|nr:ABC transporter permease subunit [Caldicoprobacter guelmensis]MBM7582184.1 putative aldouronate transport system permease protein [Caldicoprobacter guelmensis]
MKGKRGNVEKHYYLMVLPGLVWLFLFSIVPMVGIVMAFQDYNPGLGIFGSEWIGLENFRYLMQLDDSKQVIINTLIISSGKIVLNLLIPLIFALLLNEVTQLQYKKLVQTIVYLPHFISWVIMASIVINIFGYRGAINTIRGWFGLEPRLFMADPSIFRQLVIGTDVWKSFGFNAVIFLAALTSINPNLYEAATIDGTNRWQRTWYVTLPELKSTIVLLGVLGLGNILNAGFDQVYNLYNPLVYSTGDILDTWIYRLGLTNLQFSLATAAGLFKSVVSFVLITISYVLAYKFADYKIF